MNTNIFANCPTLCSTDAIQLKIQLKIAKKKDSEFEVEKERKWTTNYFTQNCCPQY